jgi:hypothetical protein
MGTSEFFVPEKTFLEMGITEAMPQNSFPLQGLNKEQGQPVYFTGKADWPPRLARPRGGPRYSAE